MRKQQREEILKVLEETYKDTKTALNYNSPFELLVAVIMSAQCTDERVNKITARIFPKYNTPEKMGALTQEELENEIRDCGLFPKPKTFWQPAICWCRNTTALCPIPLKS